MLGTAYYFRVRALGAAGNSVWVNATPLPITVWNAPAAPTNVQVTGAVNNNNARISVTWVDNAINESGYQVQRSTSASFANPTTTNVGANTTSLLVQGLTLGTAYYFRVRAVSAVGNSVWVNATPLPITVVAAPPAPTNVQVVGVVANNNARFTVTWTDNATNETGYQVRRATNAAMTNAVTTNLPPNATSMVAQGLTRGVTYYFQVRAQRATANSVWVNATPFPVTVP